MCERDGLAGAKGSTGEDGGLVRVWQTTVAGVGGCGLNGFRRTQGCGRRGRRRWHGWRKWEGRRVIVGRRWTSPSSEVEEIRLGFVIGVEGCTGENSRWERVAKRYQHQRRCVMVGVESRTRGKPTNGEDKVQL